MMNLKIVYPLSVSRVNQDGSPYEFTENRFFDQTKLFVDYQRIDSGYVAKDDDNYYLIPDEAGVEINPEMHKFGNPDINEAYKRTENVSDYTKAYAAFGKDRSLDYSAQIDKDLLDTNTENILGVSLVKVDENYQPQQVMPSVIGTGEQKVPTNNALLKETLDLIRSHIANKSNAHAIESIVELSNTLNQLRELIDNVSIVANNSYGIAESAATTAGEAAQAINEHAEATTNPHATNVTQEFADTQITPLSTETTYTPTVWSYLVGLFTTVPKSALQHLVKLWGVVKDLATRVGVLEDKLVLEHIVPIDAYSVIITKDKYGKSLNLTEEFEICRKSFVGCNNLSSNINTIFINDINSAIYAQTLNTSGYNGINSRGGIAYSCVRHIVNVSEGAIYWRTHIEATNDINVAPTAYSYAGHSIKSIRQIASVTKIELKDSVGNYLIKAGTIITIKKL